jgi:hypothetical protein
MLGHLRQLSGDFVAKVGYAAGLTASAGLLRLRRADRRRSLGAERRR